MTRIVNINKEKYDVYIGRPSIYANPFKITRSTISARRIVLNEYRQHLEKHPEIVEKARRELTGKVLGCHCKPLDCHGDILIEMMEKK
jgi:hypothetical protein